MSHTTTRPSLIHAARSLLLQPLDLHFADPLPSMKADGAGGGGGEINDAPADVGAAIVDADDDPAAGVRVRAAHETTQGPGFMCGGEGIRAIRLTTGGAAVRVDTGKSVLRGDDARMTGFSGGRRGTATAEKDE